MLRINRRNFPFLFKLGNSPMDELEIKIVLNYKVPENGLTLNGILRGLEQRLSLMNCKRICKNSPYRQPQADIRFPFYTRLVYVQF